MVTISMILMSSILTIIDEFHGDDQHDLDEFHFDDQHDLDDYHVEDQVDGDFHDGE